jgi:hypothetical protein
MPVSDSVVEDFVLTSPEFQRARSSVSVNKDHPWSYPSEVYAAGSDKQLGDISELIGKELTKKYGKSYSEARKKSEPEHFSYGMNAQPSWQEQTSKEYGTLLRTEELMDKANGGTGRITFAAKNADGKFTEKDRQNIESANKKARGEKYGEESGLNTIDFSGNPKPYLLLGPDGKPRGGRRRKTRTRKSKRRAPKTRRSRK